jgi:hypothetical protein
MKTRQITLAGGETLQVPQCVQRIDHRATHGWQLRYGGTKLYSDGVGKPEASLTRATKELLRRIATLPAPTTLQAQPSINKSSDLPVGISGPILRQRRGSRVRDASLSVSIPRFGEKPQRRNVYIGTENTYTHDRYEVAVTKAMEIRAQAEEVYRRAATRAKRAEGKSLKQQIRDAAVAGH